MESIERIESDTQKMDAPQNLNISFEELCSEIAENSSISFIDAYSILERATYHVVQNLQEGKTIHFHNHEIINYPKEFVIRVTQNINGEITINYQK